MKKKVVGLGEVLWDQFPDRNHLGGAPANFAYITPLLDAIANRAKEVGIVGPEISRFCLKTLKCCTVC